MFFQCLIWVVVTGLATSLAESTPDSNIPAQPMQPTYSAGPQQSSQDPVQNYIGNYAPPPNYGYEAGYGVQNPSMYDYMIASNYPNVKTTEPTDPTVSTMGHLLPMFRTAVVFQQVLGLLLKVAAKIGFVFVGSVGILLIGMAFTAAVCSVTPFCTISFFNGAVSQETVRSLLTPDKITATAHFVQQALDKYQKLQNTIN